MHNRLFSSALHSVEEIEHVPIHVLIIMYTMYCRLMKQYTNHYIISSVKLRELVPENKHHVCTGTERINTSYYYWN